MSECSRGSGANIFHTTVLRNMVRDAHFAAMEILRSRVILLASTYVLNLREY